MYFIKILLFLQQHFFFTKVYHLRNVFHNIFSKLLNFFQIIVFYKIISSHNFSFVDKFISLTKLFLSTKVLDYNMNFIIFIIIFYQINVFSIKKIFY